MYEAYAALQWNYNAKEAIYLFISLCLISETRDVREARFEIITMAIPNCGVWLWLIRSNGLLQSTHLFISYIVGLSTAFYSAHLKPAFFLNIYFY